MNRTHKEGLILFDLIVVDFAECTITEKYCNMVLSIQFKNRNYNCSSYIWHS